MSGTLAVWIVAVVAALAMIQLGVRTSLLSLPNVARRRCGACGRLVRRGRICRCADPDAR